jgi:hypothetical protein
LAEGLRQQDFPSSCFNAEGEVRSRSGAHQRTPGQRLVERGQQLSDGSADFAGKRSAVIEVDRMRPGPGAPYLDARTQMDVAVAKAPEEGVELLAVPRRMVPGAACCCVRRLRR